MEVIGILVFSLWDKSVEFFKWCLKICRLLRVKDFKKEDIGGGWKNIKMFVVVKILKGEC